MAIRFDEKLQTAVARAARVTGVSANAYIVAAVWEKISRDHESGALAAASQRDQEEVARLAAMGNDMTNNRFISSKIVTT